jgi:O-antigen/teichoic acid export membrane protein
MNPTATAGAPAATTSPGDAGAGLARNALHLFAGQVATTVLSILMNAALGRTLGVADFGLYFFLMNACLFTYTMVEWGQSQYLIQEVARDPRRTAGLLGGALAMRVVGSVLFSLLTGGFLLAAGYGSRTAGLAVLLITAWLPTSMTLAIGLVFRGHERMDADARTSVTSKSIALAVVLPILALGGRLAAAIVGIGAAGLGALAIAAHLARRIEIPRPRLDPAELRILLRGGFPLMIMNVVFLAQNTIESLMLSRYAAPAVLGWYGAARSISGNLVMAGGILVTASFPRLSRTAHDPVAFKREVTAALRPAFALAVLAMIGPYLFADFAIGLLYGHTSYGPAVTILQLIGPTLFLIFVDMLLGIVALAAGRAKSLTAFKCAALALATALGFPLVQWTEAHWGNGALGVIGAFGASEILMVVVFLSLVPRGVLDRTNLLDLVRSLAAGAAAVLVVRAVPWTNALVNLPLCLAVFGAVAWWSGLVGPSDAEALVAAFRRRTARR